MEVPFPLSPFQLLCLVILICFSASTAAYSSLSVIEMILAAVFFVIYMCDLHNKMPFINWPWSVRREPAMGRGLGSGDCLESSGTSLTLFSMPHRISSEPS